MSGYQATLRRLMTEEIGSVCRNEPLRSHCSWRIGGPADLLVEPHCIAHLRRILQLTRESNIPAVVIGQGTNLLFDDAGVRGVVIKIGRGMSRCRIDKNRVRAQAGIWVPQLARAVGRAGLSGMEHTIGIPGTLGGLVVMNGGSKRRSIGDLVQEVRAVDRRGRIRFLSRRDCRFSYRSSSLQASDLTVVHVELECEPGDPRRIHREMLEILRSRRRKFPRKAPSCGSVFVGDATLHERFGPPAKIIEQAGLKGLRVGGAGVSRRHANFIVNLGDGTSADVLALIRRIREIVYKRTGIWMECEVRFVSASGAVVPAHEASEPAAAQLSMVT